MRSPRHAEYVIRRLETDVFPVVGERPIDEILVPHITTRCTLSLERT